MAKSTATPAATQLSENPLVRIEYNPENALSLLAKNATGTLAQLNGVKITNAMQLEKGSSILEDARVRSEEVETFINTLREKVQNAAAKFRDYEGFEDFEVTLTIRKWDLRQLLNDGISRVRSARAKFISDEQERIRREQQQKDAEQARINKEAADKAAKEAKKLGADKQTVADIKQSVMETPAPIVQSKVLETATSTVRYQYSAKIGDLGTFLKTCLADKTLLTTLMKAIPDMEKAFNNMARDQKELFVYPGIRYKKIPVDVGARR